MEKLPLYELVLDDNDEETGIQYVSLVDEPAIQRKWQAFSKQKTTFQVQDEEKRIVSGPLMVANLPILRVDNEQRFYVSFNGDTIRKVVYKYFRDKGTSNVNLMHDKAVEGIFMYESFIINKERGIKTPEGFDELPDGSWFGSFKVDNEEVWNEFIKSGKFTGFSIEGMFLQKPQGEQDEDKITQVIKILQDAVEKVGDLGKE